MSASASARQRKHEELREAMLWPTFHFHSVLLIFNLWPISTLCVANVMHAAADIIVSAQIMLTTYKCKIFGEVHPVCDIAIF